MHRPHELVVLAAAWVLGEAALPPAGMALDASSPGHRYSVSGLARPTLESPTLSILSGGVEGAGTLLDRAARATCAGLDYPVSLLFTVLTLRRAELESWSEDPPLCRLATAEVVAGVGAGLTASIGHPNGDPVFGSNAVDRFFRDALRSRSQTTNFFNEGAGAFYAPLFTAIGTLVTAGALGGRPAYERVVSRALPLLGLGLGGTALITEGAKRGFGRLRPYREFDNRTVEAEVCNRPPGAGGRGAFVCGDDAHESFFSGHASSAFFSATFMDGVLADVIRSSAAPGSPWQAYALGGNPPLGVRLTRTAQAVAFYGLATAIAYSRIQIDRHYMTDVVAGAALGSVHGYVVYRWGYQGDERAVRVSPLPGARGVEVSWTF